MKPEIFEQRTLAWLGPIPITHAMIASLATSLLVFGALRYLVRALAAQPEARSAAAARLTFGFVRGLVTQAAGQDVPALETFAGTLFCFITGAALLGQLPGVAAPTANLPATSALATLVFLAVPYAGIRTQGARAYFKHYFEPNPLLFPLHLISELSRTLALALRLFGNMMSGHMVVALIVTLVGLFVPVPLMALDLLIGVLQAYIFTILASVYIGAALQVQRGESA